MKINNQYTSYREAYQSQINQDSNEKQGTISKKEPVEIDLSTTSKQIRLSEQVEDIDQSKKISDIKKAINEGTYHVSPKQLADKMFELL